MKKFLKSVSYALVVIFSLSFVVIGNKPISLLGVDTVSAATDAASTPATTTPAKTTTKTPVKTTTKTPAKTTTKTPAKTTTKTPAKTTTKAPAKTPAAPVVVKKADVVTSASIVDNIIGFERSIGKDGKWIICITKDLTSFKPLVLEGEFKNGKKNADGTDAIQRKIALYAQDDKRNIRARYTLVAPKLTIKSPNASIQHGTFRGDLYVSVPNFKLVDAKVIGNVYFTTRAAETTFTMDAASSITKKQLVQLAPDVVSAASIVDNGADFEKAIGVDGKWIICPTKDLVIDKPLVLEGKFKNGKKNADGTDAIQRKIGLYTQDEKKTVTARFTLTAPKLTIKSPNARIQSGTFKGDVYVSAPYFQLVDAKVDGNIYFTSKGAETTFSMDAKSSVTGKKELQLAVDAVTAASLVDNGADFEKAVSMDGKWIICTTKDLYIKKPLVLEGTFKNGKKNADGTEAIQRKIALYTQDDKRVVTARFTLAVPKLTILSPMASIQHGTFIGDIYVSVANFQLVDTKVIGNIYFTTKEAKDTFKMDAASSVTGKQELKTK